jgi:hypothetical protein
MFAGKAIEDAVKDFIDPSKVDFGESASGPESEK